MRWLTFQVAALQCAALFVERRGVEDEPRPSQLRQTALLAAERLEHAKPILWLHVPKTGTGMIRSMMSLPGVCPGLDFQTSESEYEFIHRTRNELRTMCPGAIAYDGQRFWFKHMGVGADFRHHRWRLMMMLRQPDERLLSDYHSFGGPVSWPGTRIDPRESLAPPNSFGEFASGAAGCAVKMLTRSSGTNQSDVLCATSSEKPTAVEIALAIRRLRDGAAFIGLTEQWNLSVCLLHKMFGGTCQQFELGPDPQPHNLSEMGGFRDIWDAPLYTEAEKIFQANLLLYGVSRESCQSCWGVGEGHATSST